MNFHVGQKVVYLGGITATRYGETLPQKDETYTIRSLRDFGVGVGMHLREIQNPAFLYLPENRAYEAYFDARYFRPLVEDRKSVFFTIGADPDSERWDNRKKRKEKV